MVQSISYACAEPRSKAPGGNEVSEGHCRTLLKLQRGFKVFYVVEVPKIKEEEIFVLDFSLHFCDCY